MDVAIVGFPGSGRTTVFRALLAHHAPKSGGRGGAAAVGAIHVRDPRLDALAERVEPERVVPIEIRIHDPCTSLEAAFTRAEVDVLKRMDLLALVVPAFLDPSAEASVRELRRLVAELCLQDLGAVEARLERARKEPIADRAEAALRHVRDVLEREQPVRTADLGRGDREELRAYALVTDRPWVVIRNVGEDGAAEPPPEPLTVEAERIGCAVVSLCASLEAEMAALSVEDRPAFLAEFGVQEPAGGAVTRAALESMDRITFFTVDGGECRAWEIPRGTTARAAAGKIHSDIERGFIRAEVIPVEEFLKLSGGLAEARKRGRLHVEGKDYALRDGELVHFRFNV